MAKRSKKRQAADGEVSTKAADPIAATQPLPSWWNRDWLWGLALILLVILTYSPVWWAGYVWDDAGYVNVNTYIVGPLGLNEIWTTSAADISPLANTTFWMEHALWGLAPLPYHLVNVLLHGACAVALWRVLRSLQIPGAWLGAMLWALHPVEVESVAWISEMKNTQSGLFFLLSILFFVKWLRIKNSNERIGGGWSYALTLIFAALAMASKSSTVVLPVVLCLCAWWMGGRWQWRNLVRMAPIFLMSVAASAVSIWTQELHLATAPDPQWARTWPERLAAAGDAVWFYLGKLLWPHPLITIYPRWQIDAGQWFSYVPLLAVIIILFILWLKRESWARPWFFVFAYFLTALLPVLGLVDNPIFRYSLVFDHLQYLASMGPLTLAGAGLVRLADIVIPGRLRLQSLLGAGLLLVLGLVSWQRTWVYESEETLWTDTLAKNPGCWAGHNNLGMALFQKGRLDEAMVQYQRALEINPNDAEAYDNLGLALMQKGRVDEAMAQYQKALKINPNFADAYDNLGIALIEKGKVDEAMRQFNQAVRIEPKFAEALTNRAQLKRLQGDLNGAMADLDHAAVLAPRAPQPYLNRGVVKQMQGDFPAALADLRRCRRLAPKDPNADYALLWIWIIRNEQNQKSDADRELSSALSGNWNASPGDWVSQNARFLLGQIDENEYLAAASSADKSKDQARHCEAWYYAGTKRLLAGDRIAAMADFRACLATGKTDFFEYALAQAQLNAFQRR